MFLYQMKFFTINPNLSQFVLIIIHSFVTNPNRSIVFITYLIIFYLLI